MLHITCAGGDKHTTKGEIETSVDVHALAGRKRVLADHDPP
ncbi:hypothetical protein [Streptomyces sp. NPDC059008]